MALGQFGSLTSTNPEKFYSHSLSRNTGIEFLFKNVGVPKFTNNKPVEEALVNTAEEGHVEVLS